MFARQLDFITCPPSSPDLAFCFPYHVAHGSLMTGAISDDAEVEWYKSWVQRNKSRKENWIKTLPPEERKEWEREGDDEWYKIWYAWYKEFHSKREQRQHDNVATTTTTTKGVTRTTSSPMASVPFLGDLDTSSVNRGTTSMLRPHSPKEAISPAALSSQPSASISRATCTRSRELRTDPEDGLRRTYEDLYHKCKAVYTEQEIQDYWRNHMVFSIDPKELRVPNHDPRSSPCIFEELLWTCPSHWTGHDLRIYWWNEMTPVDAVEATEGSSHDDKDTWQ